MPTIDLTEIRDVQCRVAADPDDQTPLWMCPCRECWRLECSAIRLTSDDETPVLPRYSEWLAGFTLSPLEIVWKDPEGYGTCADCGMRQDMTPCKN
jgi:hypothetical protein